MSLGVDLGLLVVGGAVLYAGAEWLVKGAAGLARSFGVKPLVIGLTVIAYGTSAPELAVSSAAIINGSSAIVLGNVIGSCIANIGLILGVTALIAPPPVDSRLIKREVPVLVLSVAVIPLLLLDGVIVRWEAALLLAGAVGFTAITLMGTAGGSDERVLHAAEAEVSAEHGAAAGTRLRLGAITFVGLALLVGGGEIFIRGARGVALALGMSERLVGLTIVAVGTSLPELAASLVAALRGHSALAIGNVIGSNIFNVFLILGVAGLIAPVQGSLLGMRLDLGALIALTVVAVLSLRGARRISRVEGALLVIAYASFVVLAVMGG